MVKRFTYAIEPGGPKRVVIESQPMWQNCQIFFDGAVIGTIPGLDALMSGMNFTLPDDSVLRVIYTNKFLISQFQVLRNGKPLPGSQSDPNELLKTAVIVTYVVGAYDTLVGLLAGLVNIKLLLSMGVTMWTSLIGALLLLLAFLTSRKSLPASILAVALFLVDSLASVYISKSLGFDFIIRLMILVPMTLGVSALNELKKQQK